nr:hypothetical protein BaRGS_020882 [Batillaria attramentaria]KAG5695781.1 hypothetical protein BaRGS_013869 [Batillaria attramentaria]KAG5705595.1 hypothetical protein BaRGS_034793 [Batillaria attramentaria]
MSEEMVASNTQEALTEISKQLARLATKDDMEQLTTKLMDRIEKLEGRVFDLETERDSLKADVQTIKQENHALKQQLQGLKRSTETRHNDLEQYQRRWNLRIFGVKETQNEDCVQKCLQVFNDKVHVNTEEADIQVAHRVKASTQHSRGAGAQGGRRAAAIIVQFANRRVRDKILQNRKVLAKSGVTISEDLTAKNFQLLKAAQVHTATITAWSSNGKIIAQLKNGKKVRVETDTDIDTFFNRCITAQ